MAVKHWRQLYEAASVDTEQDKASVEDDGDSDSTLTIGGQEFSCSGHARWMLQDMVKMGIAVDTDIDAEDEEACNVLVPDRLET